MITAKEAKELCDLSGAEIEKFLKNKVGPIVTEASIAGKRQVFISLGTVPTYVRSSITITPVQLAVVDRLKELGYRVEIKTDGDEYVPGGLADDDGNGPEHQNYGIQISW